MRARRPPPAGGAPCLPGSHAPMMASLRLMSSPRTDAGDVSAMYAGAACMARPMPRPYPVLRGVVWQAWF
jgi:hypothetical protein